ncbi:hypothetical protein ACRS81_12505 [Stutzerimonas stutzeri]|uniref:hypothetical protein n=1 Tax=Stutzerimonas stutzeri TaxID=316 RepID=UPI003EE20E02
MANTEATLAELFQQQESIEQTAAKLLRDAQGLKHIIKRNPLDAELPDLLREIRVDSDALKTLATRYRSAVVEHADAVFAAEQASRPKWRPKYTSSPGQREQARMAKRGCLVIDMVAPQ